VLTQEQDTVSGRGFFFMPDKSTAKQNKERASSVVITVIEGCATHREIEQEFSFFNL
jgi:hypothetical protein